MSETLGTYMHTLYSSRGNHTPQLDLTEPRHISLHHSSSSHFYNIPFLLVLLLMIELSFLGILNVLGCLS